MLTFSTDIAPMVQSGIVPVLVDVEPDTYQIDVARIEERITPRTNAIAPVARTRLTLETPGMDEMVAAPENPGEFDKYHPGNVSPLVAYLATADCPFNGGVFHVGGGEVGLFTNWTLPERLYNDDRWTVEELAAAAPKLLEGRPAIASEGFTIAETLAGFND